MDAHDLLEIERRLVATVEDMHKLASAVAMSRQVKEFVGDQRKNLLAKYAAAHLRDGSAAAAEMLARANPEYQAELATLADQYRIAEKHIAKWDALHCQLDAFRSSLSLGKEQIKL